jgi:cysteine desulfurase / selenocysteine lyase
MNKKNFPIFRNHTEFVYADNAATTQRPQKVIDAITDYYVNYNSNAHRGIYSFAEKASVMCTESRQKVATFIGAQSDKEIIFTKGTTDSINLVAHAWGWNNIKEGDEILVTKLEHHSNFVPWQALAQVKGATLKIVSLSKDGMLMHPEQYITEKTKLVAITHASNSVGTVITDLKNIIKAAHAVGAKVLVDGAQAVGYQPVSVQELDCDFYAFSGHKIGGPTGIGVLYVKEERYHEMAPISFGGGSVFEVDTNFTTLLKPPTCYEPGTPAIAQIIGLGAAIDYLQSVGLINIHFYVSKLVNQLIDGLEKLPHITVLGNKDHLRSHGHLVSFTVKDKHPHDVAAYLDSRNIAVRAGHHCAQITHKALGIDASIRVSLWITNDITDVEQIIKVVSEL